MIELKTFAFIVAASELILLTIAIIIGIINKFKRHAGTILCIDVLMCIIAIIFAFGTVGNRYVIDGVRLNNVVKVDYYRTNGGFYRVELDTGKSYDMYTYIRGDETCIVRDGKIVTQSKIGIRTYVYGDAFVYETKPVDYSNMSESERKALLKNQ